VASKKKKYSKKEYKGLPVAERLLAAVGEALENIDDVVECTDEWSGDGADRRPPPLLKSSHSWGDAVDKNTYEKFQRLVGFLTDAMFGVDCDNDSAVRFRFVDMSREENFLPAATVSRVDYEAPLDKWLYQLELVKMIRDSVAERVKSMERVLDSDIKTEIRQICIRQRAADCDLCQGKGWVETDKATWGALDYGERCRTQEIGCDYRKESRGPYRLFCDCQTADDDAEDEVE
jgi:hypothetical protein